MNPASAVPSPFSVPNVRLFILFRILFNARFYYPVLAVLFLDFGLTAQQYAILNVIWAASIVLLEVPSGAIADTIGRRNLLRICAALMVVEMGVITFAPRHDPSLLFFLFLCNRILSGAAEAAASGADEALAYDSLAAAGLRESWSRVLEVLMRWQSAAFVLALALGGMLYDHRFLQGLADMLGLEIAVSREITMRLPLFLVFLQSLALLFVTARMREIRGPDDRRERLESTDAQSPLQLCWQSSCEALRTTLDAGRWILQTPFAFVIILYGLLFDSVIRVFLTFQSQYLRIIQLPEASFGLIGAAFAAIGMIVPRFARHLADHKTPAFNTFLLAGLTALGLAGLALPRPYWGILPMLPLMVAMFLLGFLLSHYLNQITSSSQRATVLSFRGLAFNLAYGALGLLYAGLLRSLRPGIEERHPGMEGTVLEDRLFAASLPWWLPWFLLTLLLATLLARHLLRKKPEAGEAPNS